MFLTSPFIDQAIALRIASQAASSAKNLAKGRIDFSLSSRKPRRSSFTSRLSYKSLPNTCFSCESESRICGRSLYDVGSGNVPSPTGPRLLDLAGHPLCFLNHLVKLPLQEQRRRLCGRWPFLTSTRSVRSGRDSGFASQTGWSCSDPPWRHSIPAGCLFYRFGGRFAATDSSCFLAAAVRSEVEKIVHWMPEILFAAEIAFRRLHGCMPEQELNLL